jgi:S1-C subfamily serine protease
LVGVIRDHRPGDEVSIVVMRDGTEITATATLADTS